MDFSLNVIDKNSHIVIHMDSGLSKQNQETADFIYVMDGEIHCLQTNAIYQKDDFVIFNRFEDYDLTLRSKSAIILSVEISDTLLQQAITVDNVSFKCDSVSQVGDANLAQVREIISKLFELLLLEEHRANFLIYSNIYELLNVIIGNYSIQSTYVNSKDVKNREIVKYIYLHYSEPLSLLDIANHFYMEANYFSKYFKTNFGVNYKDYLLNTRMSFAEKDLIYTDNSMARVASDNGFNNISSFNRAFNKIYNSSPTEFRKANQIVSENTTSQKIDYKVLNERYQKIKHSNTERREPLEDCIVDVSQNAKPIKPVWKTILNIGQSEDLLIDGVQKQLDDLNKDLRFVYGRIWSVFSDELYIDWEKGYIRNFDKLNLVFDNMSNLNLIPWITINKKIRTSRRMADIHSFDIKKWKTIITEFMDHMVDRYGISWVEQWKFEVIIEDVQDDSEIKRFGEVFEVIKSVSRDISSNISVGGAGFKGGISLERLQRLEAYCKIDELDFYSMIAYPYYSENKDKEVRDTQRITSPDYLQHSLEGLLKTLAGYPVKPLYISEWNFTVSNHNMINDSRFKGSYIIRNMLTLLEKVYGLGYWGALDLNYLKTDDRAFLTGGSGLVNKFGIPKTAFLAFQFLRELEGREMLYRSDDCIITKSHNEIHLLFYNYVHPNQLYFLKSENDIKPIDIDKFFNLEKTSKNFVFKELSNGHYDIRTYTCDDRNGSLFDAWKAFNYSDKLRKSDYSYLVRQNTPSLDLETVLVEQGHLEVSRTMETNCFCAVNILKRRK